MRTFKEWLAEAARDYKRASKLLKFIHKRSAERFPGKVKYLPNIAHSRKLPDDLRNDDRGAKDYHTDMENGEIKRAKVHDVPMDRIAHGQYHVDSKQVLKKLRRGDSRLPHVIYKKETDTYHIMDGNHRVSAEKLKGKRTIQAHVWGKED